MPELIWHYTYVTYNPDTGQWYGGKHSTNWAEPEFRARHSEMCKQGWARRHKRLR
jgi:hypothetical protein